MIEKNIVFKARCDICGNKVSIETTDKQWLIDNLTNQGLLIRVKGKKQIFCRQCLREKGLE